MTKTIKFADLGGSETTLTSVDMQYRKVSGRTRMSGEESSFSEESMKGYKSFTHSARARTNLSLQNTSLHQQSRENWHLSFRSLLKFIFHKSLDILLSIFPGISNPQKVSKSSASFTSFRFCASTKHSRKTPSIMSITSFAISPCADVGSAVVRGFLYKYYDSDDEFDEEFPFSMDEQLDADVENIIRCLRQTREAMTEISQQHPIDTNELADAIDVAKEMCNNMMFLVRRYYDAREEAIRLKYRRELSALDRKQSGLLAYCAKRASLSSRHNVDLRVAINNNRREKKLRTLQDAIDKVELHRFLVTLDSGKARPF